MTRMVSAEMNYAASAPHLLPPRHIGYERAKHRLGLRLGFRWRYRSGRSGKLFRGHRLVEAGAG